MFVVWFLKTFMSEVKQGGNFTVHFFSSTLFIHFGHAHKSVKNWANLSMLPLFTYFFIFIESECDSMTFVTPIWHLLCFFQCVPVCVCVRERVWVWECLSEFWRKRSKWVLIQLLSLCLQFRTSFLSFSNKTGWIIWAKYFLPKKNCSQLKSCQMLNA